jgi:hypothetical protein
MPVVEHDGAGLFYQVEGEGPPLLLVMGPVFRKRYGAAGHLLGGKSYLAMCRFTPASPSDLDSPVSIAVYSQARSRIYP